MDPNLCIRNPGANDRDIQEHKSRHPIVIRLELFLVFQRCIIDFLYFGYQFFMFLIRNWLVFASSTTIRSKHSSLPLFETVKSFLVRRRLKAVVAQTEAERLPIIDRAVGMPYEPSGIGFPTVADNPALEKIPGLRLGTTTMFRNMFCLNDSSFGRANPLVRDTIEVEVQDVPLKAFEQFFEFIVILLGHKFFGRFVDDAACDSSEFLFSLGGPIV